MPMSPYNPAAMYTWTTVPDPPAPKELTLAEMEKLALKLRPTSWNTLMDETFDELREKATEPLEVWKARLEGEWDIKS